MARQVKYALVVAAVVLLAGLVYTDLPGFPSTSKDIAPTGASSTIQLKERTIQVTVADTPETREKGLSGRERLAEDEGMLFVFPEDGRYAFWMKDMNFAIDILWISREGIIVDLRQNVTPATYPASFAPRLEARYVLELPAGYSERYDVRPGDAVRL